MAIDLDALGAYFLARRREQDEAIADVLRGMNPRERRLVREAAVMGYVRGTMAASIGVSEIPGDSAILAEVIDACLCMSDIYPTVTKVGRAGSKRRAGR